MLGFLMRTSYISGVKKGRRLRSSLLRERCGVALQGKEGSQEEVKVSGVLHPSYCYAKRVSSNLRKGAKKGKK